MNSIKQNKSHLKLYFEISDSIIIEAEFRVKNNACVADCLRCTVVNGRFQSEILPTRFHFRTPTDPNLKYILVSLYIVSLYIEVARKNMYTFKVLILYKKFVMKATYVMIQIIKGNPG